MGCKKPRDVPGEVKVLSRPDRIQVLYEDDKHTNFLILCVDGEKIVSNGETTAVLGQSCSAANSN